MRKIFLIIVFVFTILDAKTIYEPGLHSFELINPIDTRNLRGNFAIAGNTVMCLTDKYENGDYQGYGGTCQDDMTYATLTSNMRVSKYIDIDDDNRTWNSSSSYIELPSSYQEESNGTGIAWAGLFWQGRVSVRNTYPLRYGVIPFDGSNYKETNGSGSFDIVKSDANKIWLKINNSNYHKIEADRLIYTTNRSKTYAAYADVTKLIQQAKLKRGRNLFQIANLLATEGREPNPGVFGGWSLVIIYKEDLSGKVRNISAYYGFDVVSNNVYTIKGLRLPKYGNVSSKAALFSGEGEYRYGYRPGNNSKDWIKISDDNKNYIYMPDSQGNPLPSDRSIGNRDNIFDAHLSGVKRDHIDGRYNDLQNNNDGVDVDIFDLSNIMSNYRDKNGGIDTIYLKTFSNNDYITPSMIIFATELYVPKLCYDYSLRLGDYINIKSDDRNFSIYKISDLPLEVKTIIKSEEADFDLIESKLRNEFYNKDGNKSNAFSYIPGSAKTSPPNIPVYDDAIEVDTTTGEIAIGKSPTKKGGIIGAKELIYSKQEYHFKKDSFDGKFDIVLDAKISFDGIHKVPYTMSTGAPEGSIFKLKRCQINPVYDPIWGMFNVERGNSKFSQSEAKKDALYTQVVGVPYQVSIASYKKDANGKFTKKNRVKTTLELELIDAGTFENNSSAGFDSVCNNPDTYNEGVLVYLDNKARKKINIPNDYPTYPQNLALKNAAFRLWALTKKDNNSSARILVEHNCKDKNDSACFEQLYNDVYAKGEDKDKKQCKSACNGKGGKECYKCLRAHFAIPICSRDNFSIRPQSYTIRAIDTNETKVSKLSGVTPIVIGQNINNQQRKHIAAGYAYKLDTEATKYFERSRVDGYYFISKKDSSSSLAQAIVDNTNSSKCFDRNNAFLDIIMVNGKSIGLGKIDHNSTKIVRNALMVNNVGKYDIHIEDEEWTEVDHEGYRYKPFPNNKDCDLNSTNAKNGKLNAVRGCLIATNKGPKTYPDLKVWLHPYKFDLTSLSATSSPNSSADYVFFADINDTKSNLPYVMALKLSGGIKAYGKNNSLLTNYTNGCAAYNTSVSLDYSNDRDQNLTSSKGYNLTLQNYIFNSQAGDNKNDVNTSTVSPVNKGLITTNFAKRYFIDINKGVGSYDHYINFKRDFNDPINPFKLHLGRFDIISPQEVITADLNSSFIPKGQKIIDINKTFYYARVEPKQDFYDNIYTNRVNTPVGISIYCDYGSVANGICLNSYDVNVSYITNENGWYYFDKYSTADGQISLNIDDTKNTKYGHTSINPSNPSNFNNGIAKDVNVTLNTNGLGNVDFPYEFSVGPTQNMIQNTPYLLFNKLGVNIAPSSIFGGKFVRDVGTWSGEGRTGFATDYNTTTGRKTNKVGW